MGRLVDRSVEAYRASVLAGVEAFVAKPSPEGLLAFEEANLDELPLYPEDRACKAPSTERIFDLFEPLQRHRLYQQERLQETFEPELSAIQRRILGLLRVPASAFTSVV